MDNQFTPGYMSYGSQFKTEPGQQQPASQPGQQSQQQFKSEQNQQPQSQHPPPQQQPGLSSFGSLSATPAHSQQDSPASGHPTLPPLQNQNGGYAQFGSLSYDHPGSQTHTPPTPHINLHLTSALIISFLFFWNTFFLFKLKIVASVFTYRNEFKNQKLHAVNKLNSI